MDKTQNKNKIADTNWISKNYLKSNLQIQEKMLINNLFEILFLLHMST
jgi:hypothetical protein